MQKLDSHENTLLGLATGPLALCIYQPFIFWKNTYAQLGEPFTMNPRKIYRGLGISAGLQGLVMSAQFAGVGVVKKALAGGNSNKLSDPQILFAGFCGGASSGLVCAPQELLMIQQMQRGGNIVSTGQRIVSQFGIKTLLTHGLSTCAFREGFYCAGYLALAPIISRRIIESYDPQTAGGKVSASLAGAAGGGVAAAVLSHPLDYIKTNMQSDVEQKRSKGVIQTIKVLHKAGGNKAFFNGLPWRCSAIVLATFVINGIKDQLAPVMFPHHF